ncbi:hypothetical protein ABTN75_21435, partial [Acinetobacter baumannii]
IDGVPLKLASKLLPGRTKLDFGLLTHVHLHAKGTEKVAGEASEKAPHLAIDGFRALLANLRTTVEKLKWEATGTEWG